MTMLHLFLDKGAWFRAKSYGYGSGLPIKWQGWALLAFYLAALAGIGLMAKADDGLARAGAFGLFLIMTSVFIIICRNRTEGGWRWRWGDKD